MSTLLDLSVSNLSFSFHSLSHFVIIMASCHQVPHYLGEQASATLGSSGQNK